MVASSGKVPILRDFAIKKAVELLRGKAPFEKGPAQLVQGQPPVAPAEAPKPKEPNEPGTGKSERVSPKPVISERPSVERGVDITYRVSDDKMFRIVQSQAKPGFVDLFERQSAKEAWRPVYTEPVELAKAQQRVSAEGAELTAPTPPAAAGTEPAAVPKPSKTLLDLPEKYFTPANLRKLRKDTLRRLGNSLGTEPTASAIAKRAAERFAEMPEGGGTVSMGAAAPAQFGEPRSVAGTPAHSVETGPPQDRPLGIIDPTTPSFANRAVALRTGAPTGGT